MNEQCPRCKSKDSSTEAWSGNGKDYLKTAHTCNICNNHWSIIIDDKKCKPEVDNDK